MKLVKVERVLRVVALVLLIITFIAMPVLAVLSMRTTEEPTVEPTVEPTPIIEVVCNCTCSAEKDEVIEETEPTEEPTEETEPIEEPTEEPTEAVTEEVVNTRYLGQFKLTAYCHCERCNGKWAYGPTATGTMPKEGRTIAVDPKVIPFGSKVVINGHTYVAEDSGSSIKGNRIDVFIDGHSEAWDFGTQFADVYIVEE